MVRRGALCGFWWVVCSLTLVFPQGATAQTSLTGINRDSVLQLNLGSGRNLSRMRRGSTSAQETQEQDPAAASAQMWAEWHIRANVCTGNLSTEELAQLFPLVDQELVDAVCQGES